MSSNKDDSMLNDFLKHYGKRLTADQRGIIGSISRWATIGKISIITEGPEPKEKPNVATLEYRAKDINGEVKIIF